MGAHLNHDISLEHVAEAVRLAPDLYCVPEVGECRSILVRIEGEWVNYATILLVGAEWDRSASDDICAGDLRLLRCRLNPRDISSREDLLKALLAWQRHLGQAKAPDYQDSAHVHRLYWRDAATSCPYWRIELHDRMTHELRNKQPPTGPFFDGASRFFAISAVDAAAKWFGQPLFPRNHQVENFYHVTIADRRAEFRSISINDENLITEVNVITPSKVYFCAKLYDGERTSSEVVQLVESGTTTTKLPEDVSAIGLYLMTEDGECLDEYSEGDHQQSWGPGVLHPTDPALQDLREILYGEGENTEFKAWIPKGGHKASELIRTVVAFSNTSGGVVLVGVTDESEIVGTHVELRKQYGDEFRKDIEGMKRRYIADLKKLIREGVEPEVRPMFRWIEAAAAEILRIDVPQGPVLPYKDFQSGNIYIRKSGRNRKATPAELERMFRGKGDQLVY